MTETRSLTEYEIENILSFIKPQKGIPSDTAMSVVNINKQGLRYQLQQVKIYPEMIPTLADMIQKQYFESKIQAGESVGVIGAQSIGEKQTQTTLNSIDWTDKILYSYNGSISIEPIGQMIDRLLDSNKKNIQLFQKNQTEYLELPKGYLIPSGDMNGFVKWLRIEAITRHLPSGKLVKVTTQSGRTVSASQCKSFLVWNGQSFEATLGSEVKIGDVLPTTSYLPFPKHTQTHLNLEHIFPKSEYIYSSEIVKARECKQESQFWWKHNGTKFITPYKRGDSLFGKRKDLFMNMKKGYVFLPKGKIVSYIPEQIPLDQEFGFLIGIYLAEGLITKTFVSIANNDPIIRQQIQNWCDRYQITYRTVEYKGNQLRKNISSFGITIHSVLLARLLKNICDTGSANKFVPLFAYSAPKEFIKGLIDGYYSGDGTVDKINGSVHVSSVSETLIQGISFLLSYFGIFGRMSTTQSTKNNMGSKNILPAHHLNIRNGYAKLFATNINLTENKKQERLQNITLKKKDMYEWGKFQEDFPHERDVYFDKVVSIEYVEATGGVVYDFTVEETRNFNLFNGLILEDTFHTAGSGNKTVTTGVPRVEELLNATKEPKAVNCYVKMKDKHKTIADMRKTIGYDVVEVTFEKIAKSYEIIMNKEDEKWYDSFKILYNDEFSKYNDCISIKINLNMLYEYKLTMEVISQVISDKYEDIRCVFSPGNISTEKDQNIGQIDIFVDTSNIDLPEDRLVFIDSENASEIYLEEVVQPILYGLVLSGVPGITEIYFNDDANSFETDGANFQKLLSLPFIDPSQTVSNDVWDIYYTLGIEAARQFLIEEFMNMMAGINECHISLLVEKMTHGGSISSISRYTMRNEECGPMGKASFEETMDNFLKAGVYGQDEETKGVSASIICGKVAQIGSGVCDLKVDNEALPKVAPILGKNVIEHKKTNIVKPIRVIPETKLHKRLKNKHNSSDDSSSDDSSSDDSSSDDSSDSSDNSEDEDNDEDNDEDEDEDNEEDEEDEVDSLQNTYLDF